MHGVDYWSRKHGDYTNRLQIEFSCGNQAGHSSVSKAPRPSILQPVHASVSSFFHCNEIRSTLRLGTMQKFRSTVCLSVHRHWGVLKFSLLWSETINEIRTSLRVASACKKFQRSNLDSYARPGKCKRCKFVPLCFQITKIFSWASKSQVCTSLQAYCNFKYIKIAFEKHFC